MEYTYDDMLFALASMGVKVQQTNLPIQRLGRKLSRALEYSQRIPDLLKPCSDGAAAKPQDDANVDDMDPDGLEATPGNKVDPSKLQIWSTVSKRPLLEASAHTNMQEAGMRWCARKFSVMMRERGKTGDDLDPFPLFANEFMDLRQTVMGIGLKVDSGLMVGMMEDEGKTYRIVFRVLDVFALTPTEPLYLIVYALGFGPMSPAMRAYIQKAAPPSSLLSTAYGSANVDPISMSRIITTKQEQKLWINVLGNNQRRLTEEFVEKTAPKTPSARDGSTEGSGASTPSTPSSQSQPTASTSTPANRKKNKKKAASTTSSSSGPSFPPSATLEELESILNFKLSFFLAPGPLSQEQIGELTRAGCEQCGKRAVNTCGGCSAVKYCSKNCQTEDWRNHKHLCKALSSGTWVTLRFMVYDQSHGPHSLSINRYTSDKDLSKEAEKEKGAGKLASGDPNSPKPPPNKHGDKPFLIKIQRSMGGVMPMLVYDRKREFEVNIAKVGTRTPAEMLASRDFEAFETEDPLGRALDSSRNESVQGPGKADVESYEALDQEIQRTGYLGMKAYRWAKRVSDWEVSVCLDRGPGGEVQW